MSDTAPEKTGTALNQRNLLVIGASSGIGRATAKCLAEWGATVVAVGRRRTFFGAGQAGLSLHNVEMVRFIQSFATARPLLGGQPKCCFRLTFRLVGVTGLEPATSWSRTKRSSQAELHPARHPLTIAGP